MVSWVAGAYAVGVLLALAVEDDPFPARLLVAALWPVAVVILLAVAALVASAALAATLGRT